MHACIHVRDTHTRARTHTHTHTHTHTSRQNVVLAAKLRDSLNEMQKCIRRRCALELALEVYAYIYEIT